MRRVSLRNGFGAAIVGGALVMGAGLAAAQQPAEPAPPPPAAAPPAPPAAAPPAAPQEPPAAPPTATETAPSAQPPAAGEPGSTVDVDTPPLIPGQLTLSTEQRQQIRKRIDADKPEVQPVPRAFAPAVGMTAPPELQLSPIPDEFHEFPGIAKGHGYAMLETGFLLIVGDNRLITAMIGPNGGGGTTGTTETPDQPAAAPAPAQQAPAQQPPASAN